MNSPKKKQRGCDGFPFFNQNLMGFHFPTKIFHFRRNLPFQNLLIRPTAIVISSFSTFSAENPFYPKTFADVFQECSKKRATEPGRQAHARMIISGFRPRVRDGTCLLQMYIKCSCLDGAAKVFDRMSERSCVTWTAMMFGYSVSGEMGLAQSLFDMMPERNVVSWTSLMSGYLQNGNCLKAIEVFVIMGREGGAYDETTFAVVLKAIASSGDYVLGLQVHGVAVKLGFECDVVSGTAILSMYMKYGDLLNALKVFNMLGTHDMESYTALLVGYARGNRGFEGLQLFVLLLKSGLGFDEISLSAAFSVCAVSTGLVMGTQIHGLAIKTPFHDNISVATAVLDMYGKCGALTEACRIFDEMKSRNIASWNAMVCQYAQHGYGNQALQLFEKMLLEKVTPDLVTFVGVLHACSHSGLVDEALRYLCIMQKDYGLSVVDALGRSGRIADALKLIEDMPLRAHDGIWRSLLSNCKMHGNVGVAEIAARSLLQLDPPDHCVYVLLSQVYTNAGMWDEALKMRKMMRSRGLNRDQSGCSWIEV